MSHKFSQRDVRASLFVRGVPFHIRRSQLEQVFSSHGEIRDVYIPLDYYTREPRGFAYVEFEDERDARYALKELDGARLWGQTIHIEWAKSDRKTPKEMRVQTGRRAPPRDYAYGRRGGPPARDFAYDHHRGYRGDRGMGFGGRGGGGGFGGSMGMGGRGRYRDGSYSRSPSRDRSRPSRRRSRRSRSPSSSSYSSSYSNDERAKIQSDGLPVKRSKRKKRDRSYSRSSSYSSRSRSYSSASYSSRSRSTSVESERGKTAASGTTTTVTDLSAASILPNVGVIQPDLPTAGDTAGADDGSKKKKHKKKHKHRRHRKHRHSDGSRRHKHRHKKRKKVTAAEESSVNNATAPNQVDVPMGGQAVSGAAMPGAPAQAVAIAANPMQR